MKQSIPLFRILSMALLAGVLLFFSVQLYQYFSDPLTISPVYAARQRRPLPLTVGSSVTKRSSTPKAR